MDLAGYHHVINRVNFKVFNTKEERNALIGEALEDGYTQIEIAKYLGVSRSLVSKIVREGMK